MHFLVIALDEFEDVVNVGEVARHTVDHRKDDGADRRLTSHVADEFLERPAVFFPRGFRAAPRLDDC